MCEVIQLLRWRTMAAAPIPLSFPLTRVPNPSYAPRGPTVRLVRRVPIPPSSLCSVTCLSSTFGSAPAHLAPNGKMRFQSSFMLIWLCVER